MGMQLPDWMRTMFLVVTGDGWPEADEDELWRLAAGWAGVSDTVGVLEHQAMDPVRAVRRTDWDGPAAEAFAASADVLAGHGGRQLDGLACGARELSAFIYETGVNVQYMKVIVVGELLILQAQIGWLVAMSPWTFGGSTAAVPALQVAGRSFALLAVRQLTMSIVVGQVLQVGLDASTQLVQLAAGTRKDWNTQLTTSAAVTGAVGAMVGLPLGVLGQAAGRALTSMVGKKVGEGLEHIVTNAVQEYGTDVGTGLVTGRGFVHSPFSLSAGAIEGAVDAGGGLLRGKRRGVGMPDVSSVPVVGEGSVVGEGFEPASGRGGDRSVYRMQAGPPAVVTGYVPVEWQERIEVMHADVGGQDGVRDTTDSLSTVQVSPAAPSRQQDLGELTAFLFDDIEDPDVVAGDAAAARWMMDPPSEAAGPVGHPTTRDRLNLDDSLDLDQPMVVIRKVSPIGVVSLGARPHTGSNPARQRKHFIGAEWAGQQVTVRLIPGQIAVQDQVVFIVDGVVVKSLEAADLQLNRVEFVRLNGVRNTTDPLPPASDTVRSKVDEALPMAVTRRVSPSGKVSLGSRPRIGSNPARQRKLSVGRGLAGQQAIIRFVHGQEAAQDRVVVAIAGGEVVKSLEVADLQLNRVEFAWLEGVHNTPDPRPEAQGGGPSIRAVLAGKGVAGDRPPAREQSARAVGKRPVSQADLDGDPPRAGAVQRRVRRRSTGLGGSEQPAGPEQAGHSSTGEGLHADLPMVVTRKVSSVGAVVLGMLPGNGPGQGRQRRLSVGTEWAGQQVTVGFVPGPQPAQDRVVVIVDGVAVKSLAAAEVWLTRSEFVRLTGVSNTPDPLSVAAEARLRPTVRVDRAQPMVVIRKVSAEGRVPLGTLPTDGLDRRIRQLDVGTGLAHRQVIVRFDPGSAVTQDRISAIVDGVVVNSLAAADLQLTRVEFRRLAGVSNTHAALAQWPLVGSFAAGRPEDVAGTSAGMDGVAPGFLQGSPMRAAVGETPAFLVSDSTDHDADGGDVVATWLLDSPLPEEQGGLTPSAVRQAPGEQWTRAVGKRPAGQADLDGDPPQVDAVQRRVRSRNTEPADLAQLADPEYVRYPPIRENLNLDQPMVIIRKVSPKDLVALGSSLGDGSSGNRQRKLYVGTGLVGRQVIVRFDPGSEVAQDWISIIVDGVVVKSLEAADLRLTPADFGGLTGVSNTIDPLPPARVDLARPMAINRQIASSGAVALGSAPGEGSSPAMKRRFTVGKGFAGRQVIVRFDPGSEVAQDRVSAIVDGVVVKSLNAADLRLTRGEFGDLTGSFNISDPLPPARIDLARPMVVARTVSSIGVVALGSLPRNGADKGRKRQFFVDANLAGRQIIVRFDPSSEVAQDRVSAIVDGVVVKSLVAADLQLTRDEFGDLGGASNTTDSLPGVQALPAGLVGPVGPACAAAGGSQQGGSQQGGSQSGDAADGTLSPALVRRSLGELTSFLFTDTEDHDGDVDDAAAVAWLMNSPRP